MVIKFMDGTKYYGHVIVGADGAYSVVREHMFLYLSNRDKLKDSDVTPLPFSSVCLVGQTEVLDPNDFPSVKAEYSETATVQGSSNMCTVSTNRLQKEPACFDNVVMAVLFLDSGKHSSLRRTRSAGQ